MRRFVKNFISALFIVLLLVNGSSAETNYDYNDAQEAANYIAHFMKDSPDIAIMSGSELGRFPDVANIDDKIIIDYQDIPHWPRATAPGNKGRLILGKVAGKNIIFLQGRPHYYEGYSMKAVIFPVRVLKLIGVENLIITNASGAVNKNFHIGELIAIRDHINFLPNPFIGANDERFNARFPDMTQVYDKKFLETLKNFGLKTGVYGALTGPSFETPSEVNFLALIGADLLGMSTTPEAMAAHAMNIKVCAVSFITNMAAGIERDKILSDDEFAVLIFKESEKLIDLIVKFIKTL
ncbi:MAG: purine-nucleoside phosphorylase [Synergistaceae bacterium]|nr:purine-nucleoside phosphorylase [Synergistaceae bacterium]